MKNVLITGGAGFIAHHLIYYLLKKTDWNIISLDRLDYSGNLNRLDNILSRFTIIKSQELKLYIMILNLKLIHGLKKKLVKLILFFTFSSWISCR